MPNTPIQAESDVPTVAAVQGDNKAPTDTGFAMGLHGTSVQGEGVRGETASAKHAAVAAFNHAATKGIGPAWGLYGASQVGEGVRGESHGDMAAIAAFNWDPGQGQGVWAHSDHGEGVHGETNAPIHAAIAAFNNATVKGSGPAWALYGSSQVGEGVHGESRGDYAAIAALNIDPGQGVGVWAQSDHNEAVHAQTTAAAHAAVAGFNNATGDGLAWGVYGGSNVGEGVRGVTIAGGHAAVAGFNNAANGWAPAVYGNSAVGEGVHGETGSQTAPAVIGIGKLAGRFVGDVEVTGDIRLVNADCAEQFDVAGATQLEPGTVVVFDGDGALRESDEPYDNKVAGIVSGAGEYRPAIVLDNAREGNRVPVALMGKAYCCVDAGHAPIDVGDLLTTSSTRGHAMKATDPLKAFGSVIGKALRPLREGRGMIPVLIALQ